MLPKQLHVIWIGDESRRPDNCIATWIAHNPSWSVRVWGNQDLAEYGWINSRHMREMAPRELNGVADMMRWEILYHEGGFVVDADSVCVRPLDDWLLELEAFACWENELVRPGLIAAGYVAASAGNPFIGQIIKDIEAEPSVVHAMAWQTVGPQRLTDAHKRYQYSGLSILPSHFFIPEHFSGARYEGSGPIYAQQHWGSTRRSYDTLHLQAVGTAAGAQPAATTVAAVTQPPPEPAPAPAPVTPPAMPPSTPPAAPADTPAAPRRSPLEDQHAPYFVQKVTVSRELVGRNRVDVFRDICKGRRVLHVGCTDWPISDPASSLHVQLDSACAQLDGFDIHTEAFEVLQPHVRGRFFSDWSQVTDAYDIVLVPEVLEHVPNTEQFLQQLDAVRASHVILTVPDAFQCMKRHFDYVGDSETFVEVVHPDHNCWYTPYTLTSTLKKYTPWTLDGLWFFNNISLLAITSKR